MQNSLFSPNIDIFEPAQKPAHIPAILAAWTWATRRSFRPTRIIACPITITYLLWGTKISSNVDFSPLPQSGSSGSWFFRALLKAIRLYFIVCIWEKSLHKNHTLAYFMTKPQMRLNISLPLWKMWLSWLGQPHVPLTGPQKGLWCNRLNFGLKTSRVSHSPGLSPKISLVKGFLRVMTRKTP